MAKFIYVTSNCVLNADNIEVVRFTFEDEENWQVEISLNNGKTFRLFLTNAERNALELELQ